jgi:hypothetical protein
MVVEVPCCYVGQGSTSSGEQMLHVYGDDGDDYGEGVDRPREGTVAAVNVVENRKLSRGCGKQSQEEAVEEMVGNLFKRGCSISG